MIRQVASLGMRQALKATGQRAAGHRFALPNNSALAVCNRFSKAAFSSSSSGNKGIDQEQLEVPSNIEKSNAAQQAVFHLEKGPQPQPSYQPDGPVGGGGFSAGGSSAYDQRLSLHSVMQSNVPQPFSAPGKSPSHHNMPGSPDAQTSKYVAQQVQQLHSNSKTDDSEAKGPELSKKEKFKKAVKEYGATLVVFHVGISLVSLGACYTAVSSGLDLAAFAQKVGFQIATPTLASAGTFVVAYAVHKVFAPVRISITLASVPFLVKYLRVRKKVNK